METLIIASLIVISIASAALAERQRRRAEALQTRLDLTLAHNAAKAEQRLTEATIKGWKHGWAESYAAACKAMRAGHDPAEAVLAIKKAAMPEADYEGANVALHQPYYIRA